VTSLTVTDLFCGAGGSSSGAEAVAGVRVRMATNHWALAIETHNTNHPHVDHDVADISEVDPRRYPRTDLLWASPSCTFWSPARGERRDFADDPTEPSLFDLAVMDDADDEYRALPAEARERSRALMHDVPRFAEHHRYRAVIVENVPALLSWWYFPKWIARMRALGYAHHVLTLNSAFAHQLGAPAPQLRDRVYVVFWLTTYQRPDFDRWTRPRAWCPSCEQVVTALIAPKNPKRPYGSYGAQWVLRCPATSCRHGVVHPYVMPAAAAIDWATPGQRIGDRARPLAAKTMARIEAGLRRHAPLAEAVRGPRPAELEPFVTVLRTHGGNQPVRAPLRTVVAGTTAQALLVPVEGRDGKHAAPAARPHRTQTARAETGLLVPAGGTWNTEVWPTGLPMRTRTTRESEALVTAPVLPLAMVMRNNTARAGADGGNLCSPITEPVRTLTTAGHQSLVWQPDLLLAYDTGLTRRVHHDPMPTQTTIEGDALLAAGVAVEDCLFRMLTPEEIKLGMSFPRGFVLLGTKAERVRLCGNAVTPPVARDLIAAVAEAITGSEVVAA
jgi:DNA (cytosine-5)-methyltransferase 1